QRNVIKARAAILFGDAHPEQVQFSHLREDFAMAFLLLVPFLDVRRNFFLRKLAHSLHQRVVVVGKLTFDHILSTDYTDYTDLENKAAVLKTPRSEVEQQPDFITSSFQIVNQLSFLASSHL